MARELTKQNVLALTGVWTGVKPFFFDADENIAGMPAFFNVFSRLVKDERVEKVHLILLVEKKDYTINIPESYKAKLVVHDFYFNPRSFLHSLWLFGKITLKGISISKQNKINNIAGFGSLAGLSAIIATILGIKDFRRLFGSFLINEISDSKLKIFKRHPLEYLCFALKGKALLITNDGTKGDIVFEKLGTKKLAFHFPLNGVDRNLEQTMQKPSIELPENFLTYIARLDDWKRQHLLVEALGILKQEGIELPHTYIIGAVTSQAHFQKIKDAITKHALESSVTVIEGMPAREVHYMMNNSLISYSLYHTSNLGNVFLEALRLGTAMIALNDTESLAQFPKDIYREIRDAEPNTIADATRELLKNNDKRNAIAKAAKAYADAKILNWDERAKIELDIILN